MARLVPLGERLTTTLVRGGDGAVARRVAKRARLLAYHHLWARVHAPLRVLIRMTYYV